MTNKDSNDGINKTENEDNKELEEESTLKDFDFEDTLNAKKKTLISSSSKGDIKQTKQTEEEYSKSLNADLIKVVIHKTKKHFDMFADDADYNHETHGVSLLLPNSKV